MMTNELLGHVPFIRGRRRRKRNKKMGNSLRTEQIDKLTGLTDKEAKAIRDTWRMFCDRHPDHGMLIFNAMFVKNPKYLELFPKFRSKSMAALQNDAKYKAHGSAVGHHLSAMVDTLDDTTILVEMMRKNAENHTVRAGVTTRHFRSLCRAVLEVLEMKLGSDLTPLAVVAWDKLFEVSNELCANARQALSTLGSDCVPAKKPISLRVIKKIPVILRHASTRRVV